MQLPWLAAARIIDAPTHIKKGDAMSMNAIRRALAAAILLNASTFAAADVITEWNATAISTNTGPASLIPARVLATMHGSMFDAVNAVTRTYKPYLVEMSAPEGTSAEAAAATAAHTVLSRMTTGQQAALDAALQKSLSPVAEGPGKAEGMRLGREIGEKFVAARDKDGSEAAPAFTPVSGPGKWMPTPPANLGFGTAHWGKVKPFVIARADEFTVKGPPALDSEQYARDYEEVKRLGARDSTARTGDQTASAVFWTAQTNIPWNAAARAAVTAKNLPLIESARVFAALGMATHDSLVAGWHVKAAMPFWRPVSAIRGAGELNNAKLAADAKWEPLLVTPPHPDYVSGHCVGSGAAEAVLKGLLGDAVQVTVTHPATNQTRTFTSFTQMGDDVEGARIWSGIHTRTADVDGRELGRRVGEAVLQRFPRKA